ncbi:response regulator [Francisella tularensis subsp. novicida]|uniref:response regulator n=1 Tax=Francisella tularensis TaxID=263 RepID=UPI00050784EE|nr:response regulator [Francisella tularensis]AJJ48302.1 response regulator [Francisella tularensis subsp. novicida]KFJ70670.1 response regulator [Francisella tularensis subsp. novicida]MBK2345281.1 response regulator [Francisella tularensis subsp. novicida]MBK2350633.1 response regulator [Francisella tularensis subsp. novicida]MBK2354191.1 response regulator [Francisella tularensis subsp. novicida]
MNFEKELLEFMNTMNMSIEKFKALRLFDDNLELDNLSRKILRLSTFLNNKVDFLQNYKSKFKILYVHEKDNKKNIITHNILEHIDKEFFFTQQLSYLKKYNLLIFDIRTLDQELIFLEKNCYIIMNIDNLNLLNNDVYFYSLSYDDLLENFDYKISKLYFEFCKQKFSLKLKNNNKITILSIEDDLTSSTALKDLLEIFNISVVTCLSGQQALYALEQFDYDFIILDLGLPDIEGSALIVEMQEKMELLNKFICPIIINTGYILDPKLWEIKFFSTIVEIYNKPSFTFYFRDILGKYLPKGFFENPV